MKGKKLRQIALVAKELAAIKTMFFDLLGISQAHIDPKIGMFGLDNIVMTLGDTFLEIVSPVQAGTTAGRLLDKRGGDGGYMVIIQVEDFNKEKARLAKTDIRIAWQTQRDHASAMHLHPKDVPGAIASLDQMNPPEAWHWAGANWEQHRARSVGDICAANIQSQDPQATASRWALAYGLELDLSGPTPTMALDQSEIRFVLATDGRGEGLSAIDIAVRDTDAVFAAAARHQLACHENAVTVCGVTLNFVENGCVSKTLV
tara:strand:+ start:4234 stop:5013 length:780 start_codon:yes stop_codon:yes gene_type:complete